MESATPVKIAVIGLGCRLPPAGNSLAGFWRFLLRGGNALRPHRADRWDYRQFFDEDPARPGKTYAPKAATLDADLRQFDPLAFGISPREAAALDPQQRLLLESAWEAFEDAGLPLDQLSGSLTGVFVGGFCLDHLLHATQPSNRHLLNAHAAGGVMMTVLSNRLSHAFNLRGPSLTIDTACSSSLVALHYACQSLRLGESDLALAGGVNAMMRPDFPIIMSKGHFLSPHGECHAFDETAAGYARGEGAGILVLKRLDDALRDGDPIHAVIRATGVNQDGHTDGIALPNPAAQEALVRRVYSQAGVDFADVDYVEAHGTGTQAGDQAELGALDRCFSPGRPRPLVVGSVKTNVGHLEAAAGVAGLFKTIGVLQHRLVPRNLHFQTPNPRIPFADYRLQVAAKDVPLPDAATKPTLLAGINSFGYGGTNAHAVLESPPPPPDPPAPAAATNPPRLIPFSATSEEALRDLAGKFAFQLGGAFPGTLDDLAHTAAFRRSHLPVRLTALAASREELREQLIAASTGQPHPHVVTGGKAGSTPPAPVFVYTGMGPQWWAMGRELFATDPLSAATLDEVDALFAPLAGWSLRDALLAPEADSRMAHTDLAQPANFVLQLALTRWWESRGIRPAAVVGHSVGEVTAAHVAGVYTLAEAVRVSFHRSRLQQTCAGRGAMLAVGLPEAEASALIADEPAVSLAAINSFSAVTLSGDRAALERIAAALESRGVFQKFLRVEVAYHSPQMDPLRDELLAVLADLDPRPARLPLYSTAHGRIVPGETWTAAYWWDNVRHPVRFADALRAAFDDGHTTFLEIGPHPVLGNAIKECAATLERRVATHVSLRRAEPELPRLLLTLGALYGAGAPVDWTALAPATGRFLRGPQYPWQRQTHWLESDRSRMERLGLAGPVYLNRTVPAPTPCWEVEVNRHYFPFLPDHGVQDQTVFPGLGYVEAGLCLSHHLHGPGPVLMEDIRFERVLVVEPTRIQTLLTEFDAEGTRFLISSRTTDDKETTQRHCRGRFFPLADATAPRLDLTAWRAECPTRVDVDAFHAHLDRCELHYGPAFRPITAVHVGPGCYVEDIDATTTLDAAPHPLHPTLFDAAIRGVLYLAAGERLYVPFSFERFTFYARPERAECVAVGRLLEASPSRLVADVWLTDAEGRALAHVHRMSLQAIDTKAAPTATALFYQPAWSPADPLSAQAAQTAVLFAAEEDPTLASALAAQWPGTRLTSDPADLDPTENTVVVLAGTRPFADPTAARRAGERLIALLQTAVQQGVPRDFTLLTRNARAVLPGDDAANWPAAPLAAIGFVAQNEHDFLTVRSLDLPAAPAADEPALITAEIAAGTSGETALRHGSRHILRLGPLPADAWHVPSQPRPVAEPVALAPAPPGRLDSLHFEAVPRREPAAGEIEIRVHTAALNYKDFLKLTGRLTSRALEGTHHGDAIGMEATGTVLRAAPGSRFAPGDRVLASFPGALRSYATLAETFIEPLPPAAPESMAGAPVVFLTAYHALVQVARLQPGERILIQHATGGLGQAATAIARWIGAEILATAGSEEKRAWLRAQGIASVFPSRSADFAPAIRALTADAGVDVILGAQTPALVAAGLNLLRPGGRYIETGKPDPDRDFDLPSAAFGRGITYSAVDVDLLAQARPALVQETLRTVYAHLAAGDFALPTSKTFAARDLRAALAEMESSRHLGKLLIDFSAGDVDVVPPRPPLVRADGAYLITGGTSGFGLLLARWLATQGAGQIWLASRSGPNAPGIAEFSAGLRALGSAVEVRSVDFTDATTVHALVSEARSSAFPLRGVIHGAMVLDDALLRDLTPASFERVFNPKALGAAHLAAALDGSDELDFLVFSSSVSALVGNRGQTSYVAANAALDALAHHLRHRGLPALSINWGALAESGVVARDAQLGGVLASTGITGLDDRTALHALGQALRLPTAQVGAFLVDWERWLAAHPRLRDDPRFQPLASATAGGTDAASHIRAELSPLGRESRLRAMEEHLRSVLATTLKMPADAVPLDRKVNELGVDSLLVLELSLGINERLGVNFSAMEFLKGPTLQQLAAMAESRLWEN